MSIRVLVGGAYVNVKGVHELRNGAWVPFKGAYSLELDPGQIDPPVYVWRRAWRKITAPTVSVPGLGIAQGAQLLPPQVVVSWTARPLGHDHYDYFVEIRWYVDGVQWYFDSVHQNTGSRTREFEYGQSIYARVNYVNTAGSGPQTQTSTIFL